MTADDDATAVQREDNDSGSEPTQMHREGNDVTDPSLILKRYETTGLEPVTRRLTAACSTN